MIQILSIAALCAAIGMVFNFDIAVWKNSALGMVIDFVALTAVFFVVLELVNFVMRMVM